MKTQYIFYIVGLIFIFASVIYFAKEFIVDLPRELKAILLILATAATFIIAEILRGKDK